MYLDTVRNFTELLLLRVVLNDEMAKFVHAVHFFLAPRSYMFFIIIIMVN